MRRAGSRPSSGPPWMLASRRRTLPTSWTCLGRGSTRSVTGGADKRRARSLAPRGSGNESQTSAAPTTVTPSMNATTVTEMTEISKGHATETSKGTLSIDHHDDDIGTVYLDGREIGWIASGGPTRTKWAFTTQVGVADPHQASLAAGSN